MEHAQPSPAQRVLAGYDARLAALRGEAAALERRSGRISVLRGVTLLTALGGGAWALFGEAHAAVAVLSGAVGAAFLVLVVKHALLVTRMTELDQRIALYERAKKRVAGDFAGFPERGERFAPAEHDYARDLDVFGQASVFQLLNAAQTGEGEATLAAWLTAPAPVATIAARQAAARELAEIGAFREELAALGVQAGARGREADALVAWAEAPAPLAGDGPAGFGAEGAVRRPGAPNVEPAGGQGEAKGPSPRTLVTAARLLVALTVAAFAAAQILGPERLGLLRHAWLAPLLLQVVVLGALRPVIEPILSAAASREAPFGRYRPILACIEQQDFRSPLLCELRQALRGEGRERGEGALASREMTSLQRILGYADLRHSGLVHFIVNTLVLWDVWCALALDRWRVRAGRHVRAWMQALGQMEALASLGTFAWENPDYAFPELVEGAGEDDVLYEADGLGHPLLQREKRVTNDVALRGAGTGLLVTGSNMSGKSTLLRAMGVNAVLALAGAPVCATRLRMAPLAVRTSMRIEDSLERGVSHFYAELTRLKRVVDSANAGERVLFLLDEILHGTNSRERILGAKAIVTHLLDKGAIGAVSSHDLGLCPLEEESGGRVRNVHFEELVIEGKMSFDYKLKQGVVKTANALRLMKIVGIAVDLPEA